MLTVKIRGRELTLRYLWWGLGRLVRSRFLWWKLKTPLLTKLAGDTAAVAETGSLGKSVHQADSYWREGDGGYVVGDIFSPDQVDACYSLGVGSDVSCDRAIANCGIPVFLYDHTVGRPAGGT